jgi:hypothetical protein
MNPTKTYSGLLLETNHLSYINRNRARQTGTNRTTQAEISNLLRLSFPGRVNNREAPVMNG